MQFLGVEIPYAEAWTDLVQRADFASALRATEAIVRPDALARQITPPAPEQIFRVLTVSDVRVVIVGQDPYFNAKEATGFAFEVGTLTCWQDLRAKRYCNRVPSIKRLLRKLYMDHTGAKKLRSLAVVAGEADNGLFPILAPNQLFAFWANQGVLLLNHSLSTRLGHANAHQKAWRLPVKLIAEYVATKWPEAIWCLWGGPAKELGEHVPAERKICCSHPNPKSIPYSDLTHFIHTDCFTRKLGIDWLGVAR